MSIEMLSLDIDVSAEANLGEPASLSTWLFVPEPSVEITPKALLVCTPGGSYTKAYWHLSVPGHPGYSFAEHLAARGFLVATFDVLGTGQSTQTKDPNFTSETVARAHSALVKQLSEGIAKGSLTPSLEPRPGLPVIGIGHSMGGFFTIRQQALCGDFDAVAILGYTTLFPMLLYGLADQSVFANLTTEEDGRRLMIGAGLTPYAVDPGMRKKARMLYHLDDVPDPVVAADDAEVAGSPGFAGLGCLVPGIVAADAASIDVPVFIGFGERDTSRDPWAEPGSYRRARDVTLHVLEGSAHCTNFATTRHAQWNRIGNWAESTLPINRTVCQSQNG